MPRYIPTMFLFFVSSRRRHTRCALVTGVQTCALPIFRMIEAGCRLVADDRTILTSDDARLIAAAPENIRGLIELRGLGPVEMNLAAAPPVVLLIALVPQAEVARLCSAGGR